MSASSLRFLGGICLLLPWATDSLGAGATPRYALRPGQVISYEENRSHAEGASRTTWRLWVVQQNGDGSWHVVVRAATKRLVERDSASRSEETVSLEWFDILPDGAVPRCTTLVSRLGPALYFPRLPADDREAAAGWMARDEREDATIRYKPDAANDSQARTSFEFEADQRTARERMYDTKDCRTFHFDYRRNLVVRAEIALSLGAGMRSVPGTLELKSVEELDAETMAAFGADMDRYFVALRVHHELCSKARLAGSRAEGLVGEARTVLANARAHVTVPEASAALDERLRSHDGYASRLVDDSRRFAEIVGHPAPTWELKDLEGQTHTLEQYRGKVVVLDFWYRYCGWCIRAMPQVKEIARHYRDRPVAVFGLNIDRDLEFARFVAREMELNYPVLRSRDLAGKYGVHSYPTLIIIDQQGKVSDIHLGYSAELFEDVTAAVDRLLDAK
jgi:thiol-disulfide isomerase/thioredoxin